MVLLVDFVTYTVLLHYYINYNIALVCSRCTCWFFVLFIYQI